MLETPISDQFLQSQGTVQGFPFAALVLASLIEKRHDHIDTVRFSVGCGNDTLQILIVVVRRHMIFVTADRVGQAVVQHIGKDEKIHASYGLICRIPLASPVPKRGQQQSIR